MKHLFLRPLFLALAVFGTALFPVSGEAAPQWDAPTEVSQGHAFLVRASDRAPFEASVVWRDKKVPLVVSQRDGQWEGSVLLAVPIDAKGNITLTTVAGAEKQTLTVKTLPVPWHEERITVAPKYVTPPPEVEAQIKRDQERSGKVINVIRPEQEWTLPLQRPVKGTISGSFGGRRVLNGQPRAPHKGTDMRGAQGTPVKALADGIVVLAEPQYFSGNVIYIDHGQGVISMYGHLSAFDVTPGEKVKRGQTIGKVGATGRVTGPHLHLGLLVQGVAVDAMPLYVSPLVVTGGPTKEEPRPAAPAPDKKAAPKPTRAARP